MPIDLGQVDWLYVAILAVCTENPIRIDWRRESPNVGAQ